jgi:hypothetical protein
MAVQPEAMVQQQIEKAAGRNPDALESIEPHPYF